jgi:hypothetical protein
VTLYQGMTRLGESDADFNTTHIINVQIGSPTPSPPYSASIAAPEGFYNGACSTGTT